MAKFYDRLTSELQAFIKAQHIFFVATAPNEGRVNLSPKGMDSQAVAMKPPPTCWKMAELRSCSVALPKRR